MAYKFYWLPYALVRIVLFYVVGILLAIYNAVDISRIVSLLLLGSTVSIFIALWFLLKKERFTRYSSFVGFVGLISILLLGYSNLKWNDQSLNETHILNQNHFNAYRAVLKDNGYETDKTIRYLIEVEAIHNKVWRPAQGLIYFYLSKEDSGQFNYGDIILVKDSPKVLEGPFNPGEFDYKRFLSFNNIFHQQYSNGNNIVKIGHGGNDILARVYNARKFAVNIISNKITSERERNIALALVLGNKDGLTDEIKNAYSASGAMHVLAVSGLHVGIIYGIMLLLFGKMDRTTLGRWGLAIISLVLLWSYAAITGFSPSVLRAVTMFSFVAVAKASLSTTNIYNTLAASAFVLLLWNPFLIMSVGFQLSYLAVIGIVFIQPKVYKLFISNNFVVDWIWQITSVSIAAQIATFTLGLLYFHQFPTFFLLSNLVVIPGAFLILFGGILTISTSYFDTLSSIIGELTRWLIYSINEVVFWIESLPYSLIQGVYISTYEAWIIIVAILSLILLYQLRSVKLLYVFFVCCVFFGASQWKTVLANSAQNQLTIYRISNHLAIDFNSGGKSILYTDSTLLTDANKVRFHIQPNQLRTAFNSEQKLNRNKVQHGIDIIQWKNKKIIILSDDLKFKPDINPVDCDILILSDGYHGKIDQLQQRFNFDQLILDGSLRKSVAEKLAFEAEAYQLNVYSVQEKGAIQLKI